MKSQTTLLNLIALMLLPLSLHTVWGENLIPNGNLESGSIADVFYTTPLENINPYQGSPGPDSAADGTNICAEVTLSAQTSRVYFKPKMPVDPNLKYQLSVRIFTEADINLKIGGYGKTEDANPVLVEGGRHWGFILKTEDGQFGKGPFTEWTTLKATFGPEGTGADSVFVPAVSGLNLVFWITGDEGQKFYIDDVKFEEVESFY